MYRIAVDLMGSDDAPKSELEGITSALELHPNLEVIGFGSKEAIEKMGVTHERLTYVYTTDVILGTDVAATAYRAKKDASMIRAIQAVKEGSADAIVSSGNTGAYITSALFMLGRIKGIKRPALATLFPTEIKGKRFVFGDLGAVVDPTPDILEQTGVVIGEIAKIMLDIKEPKIALLNIGEEEKKGTPLYIEAHQLLKKNEALNFVGNIEPRYLMDGKVDVVVGDGFAGNIALKSYEGMQKVITGLLKKEIMKGVGTKIGGLLIKPALKELKATLDYDSLGGAVLAGIKSPVIKAHGTTTGTQYSAAISFGLTLLEKDLVGNISKAIEQQAQALGDEKKDV